MHLKRYAAAIGVSIGSWPHKKNSLLRIPHYVRRLLAGVAAAGGVPEGAVVDEARLDGAVSEAARGFAARPHRRSDGGWTGDAHSTDGRGAGDVHRNDGGHAGDSHHNDGGGVDDIHRGDGGSAGSARFAPLDLPGPTGESNRLSFAPRGVVLCLGPGLETVRAQLAQARDAGNAVVVVAGGAVAAFASQAAYPRVVLLDRQVAPETLATLGGIAAVACSADGDVLAAMRAALARRRGPIVPLITEPAAPERYVLERHVCVDTMAAGSNALLLAQAQD